MPDAPSKSDSVNTAIRHAVACLVFGNAVGLYLALLLLKPDWQLGALSYGRWMPVHLNVQLYGWTSLPLVAWLLSIYQVPRSRHPTSGHAAVWAWTAALAVGVFHWLDGNSSGKLFLDWKNGSLHAFIVALVILWCVLAVAWLEHRRTWGKTRSRAALLGLLGLGLVPISMIIAASPSVYPPIDRTTGGPTGSSLQGSALFVVGLMLLLPRIIIDRPRHTSNAKVWIFLAISFGVFGVTEAIGGTHRDPHQIFSVLLLLPWVWLLPHDWKGFDWPQGARFWRDAMFGWWGFLVLSSLLMYQNGILDRIKFTQALVAHSHMAMAGFTTSFCALLIVLLTRRPLGSGISVLSWHAATLVMLISLAAAGWMEGGAWEWMLDPPAWRVIGFTIRALCGAVMLTVSANWLWKFKTSCTEN
jgi:cytochrome c oxidase cbb3-type subunit 1